MTLDDAAAALRAARDRARQPFRLESVLFGPQLAFARDPASFATAVCSRRAGKSVGVAAWLEEGPLVKPGAPSLYLTKTRGSAKRIIWGTLLDLNRRYSLGFAPNEADLILKLGGKGAVYLAGIDNKAEIEKIRGTGWGRVAIDEAQVLPEYIQELVEDVLMPSLMDHDGQIRMIGTPPPVPVGYFAAATRSDSWKHHGWTVWDNPYIPDAQAKLAEVLKIRGISIDDPSIRREWFGEWTFDLNSLVFRYDAARNHYEELPKDLTGTWWYCIGIDVGFDDSDAIAVLAWNDHDPRTWLKAEKVQAKQDITSLANSVRAIWEDLGKERVRSIVMDTGGIGKKVAEELSARHRIPVAAAQKAEKQVHIELLNDALRTGRLMAKSTGRFAHDAMLVEWDKDKSTPDKRVVSDKFHSDIADAVLYAFRESLAWTSVVPVKPYEVGSKEWIRQQERQMFERAQREVQDRKRDKTGDAWGVGEFDFGGGIEW